MSLLASLIGINKTDDTSGACEEGVFIEPNFESGHLLEFQSQKVLRLIKLLQGEILAECWNGFCYTCMVFLGWDIVPWSALQRILSIFCDHQAGDNASALEVCTALMKDQYLFDCRILG